MTKLNFLSVLSHKNGIITTLNDEDGIQNDINHFS